MYNVSHREKEGINHLFLRSLSTLFFGIGSTTTTATMRKVISGKEERKPVVHRGVYVHVGHHAEMKHIGDDRETERK